MNKLIFGFATLVATIGLLATQATAQTVTRYEAEAQQLGFKDANDLLGRYYYYWGEVADANASNGKFMYTPGEVGHARAKLLFHGTGIRLIVSTDANGADFQWVLDEGAQTGNATTYGAAASQVVITIAEGLPKTLHTLELIHSGKANGVDLNPDPELLRVDAFDILDDSPRVRIEQNDYPNNPLAANPAITYQPGGETPLWYEFDEGFENAVDPVQDGASQGSIGYAYIPEITQATFQLEFEGTAIIFGTAVANNYFGGTWSIDGQYSGVIDMGAITNNGVFASIPRWPILLKNDLSDGPHTLTFTADKSYGSGTDFICVVDFFEIARGEGGGGPVTAARPDAWQLY